MNIEQIRIDNFGSISNRTIGPLQRPLTVIQGSNEAGKTTLLAFIRHILFGFPTGRTNENRYRMDGSEKHGGSITIVAANGERYVITRHGGRTAAGTVSIVKDDMTPLGEAELPSLLSYISKDIFQSIFAFDIDQLSGFDIADNTEIASRLYGAGAGVNTLPKVLRDIAQKRQEIFRPGGSTQPVAKLLKTLDQIEAELRAVNDQASQYKKLNEEITSTNILISNTGQDLKDAKTRLTELKQWVAAYEHWVKLQLNKDKKAELPGLIEFPEDAIQRLDNIETNLKEADDEFSDAQDDYKVEQKKTLEPIPDEFLLSEIPQIEFIQESREAVKLALHDLPIQRELAGDAKSKVNDELRSLGNEWTQERVKTFDISITRHDEINQHETEIEKLDDAVSVSKEEIKKLKEDRIDANNRLQEIKSESNQQTEAMKSHSKANVLPSILLMVGIVLVIYGSLANFQLVSGLGIGLGIVSVWIFTQHLRSNNSSKEPVSSSQVIELQIQQLDERLKRAINELNKGNERAKLANDKWTEWLRSNNLPGILSPTGSNEFLSHVRLLSNNISEVDSHIARTETIQKYLDDTRAKIKPIGDQLDIDLDSNDYAFLIAIDQIIARYKATENAAELRNASKALATDRKRALDRLEKRLKDKTSDRDEFLQSGGTNDAEDFRRRAIEQNERREIEREEKDLRDKLLLVMGPNYQLKSLDGILNTYDEESLEAEISENGKKQEELENEDRKAITRLAELNAEIDQLIDDETASELLTKKAKYEDQLETHAEQWSRMAMASALLERTRHRYEREKQPAILERASGYLNNLTNKRYDRVFNPIDGQGFKIVESGKTNSQKQPEQLSRGTKEQLYLSLRFASVEEFGDRQEPLPVIVDEVLVNFDPKRAAEAAKSFLKVAEKNQVIVFTCHPWVRDLFTSADVDVEVINL